jgi:hypothetical protein
MKHYIFAGLSAVLIAGELVGPAPQASAGCQYGGIAASRWGLTYTRGASPSTTHRHTSTIDFVPLR